MQAPAIEVTQELLVVVRADRPAGRRGPLRAGVTACHPLQSLGTVGREHTAPLDRPGRQIDQRGEHDDHQQELHPSNVGAGWARPTLNP